MPQKPEYINSFIKQKYDRITVLLPKGALDRFRAVIGGESVNGAIVGFVSRAIEEGEQKAGGKTVAVTTKQAGELLGMKESSIRTAISRGQLERAGFEGSAGESLVTLGSVIRRAAEKGLDIAEKLKEMGLGA